MVLFNWLYEKLGALSDRPVSTLVGFQQFIYWSVGTVSSYRVFCSPDRAGYTILSGR
jgi:hypothetical protein